MRRHDRELIAAIGYAVLWSGAALLAVWLIAWSLIQVVTP